MRKFKLYLETSVWNFYFADDSPEKRDITKKFFKNIKQRRFDIFISQTVLNEIDKADEVKKNLLIELIKEYQPQDLEITQEVADLAQEYISQTAIPKAKMDDALHVAIAAVYEIDALISWNNKHIANLSRMSKINAVNLNQGYMKHLQLITPMEVVIDEN